MKRFLLILFACSIPASAQIVYDGSFVSGDEDAEITLYRFVSGKDTLEVVAGAGAVTWKLSTPDSTIILDTTALYRTTTDTYRETLELGPGFSNSVVAWTGLREKFP